MLGVLERSRVGYSFPLPSAFHWFEHSRKEKPIILWIQIIWAAHACRVNPIPFHPGHAGVPERIRQLYIRLFFDIVQFLQHPGGSVSFSNPKRLMRTFNPAPWMAALAKKVAVRHLRSHLHCQNSTALTASCRSQTHHVRPEAGPLQPERTPPGSP